MIGNRSEGEIATDAGADAGSNSRVDGVNGGSGRTGRLAEAVQASRLRCHGRSGRRRAHARTIADAVVYGGDGVIRGRQMMTVRALVKETDVASLRMLLSHGTSENGGGGRKRDRRQRRHLLTCRRELHEIRLHRLTKNFVVEIDD